MCTVFFLLLWVSCNLVSAENERPITRRGLIFRDDFNDSTLHRENYVQELTMSGGGNAEFQIYTPEDTNTFVRDGYLYIKPTFTADNPRYGGNLYSGRFALNNIYQKEGWKCTDYDNWGCDKTITNQEILNPIMSGRLYTQHAIKYGKVTVRAKIPKGDWLWPAIWMLPRDSVYGGWPQSGEIDLMESMGNTRAMDGGVNKGIHQVSSTLHWGPDMGHNKFSLTHGEVRKNNGDFHDFHDYKLDWTEDHIQTFVDDQMMMNIPTPSNSFWGKGGFTGYNLWQDGGLNAPFDQPFRLILNVAVGGNYFQDSWSWDTPKPWTFGDGWAKRHFWEKRGDWQPTWHGDDVAMIVDYIEMIQY